MARLVATGEHKAKAARQMRVTAGLLDAHHPEMMAGDHLRDAARLITAGRTDGAKRHLDAAMFMLTPQSLIRHGILDDDGHADAKHHMHQINRHRLAIEDIEDINAANQRAASMARAARGEPEPMQPFDRPPPEFLTVGQSAHGTFVAANSSPAVLLSFHPDEPRGPGGQWIKVDDAGHLDGQQVLGTDAHGQTFLGTYSHVQRSVLPRPGKLQTRYVRRATDQDIVTIRREQARRHAVRMGLARSPGGLANVLPGIELSARTPFLARTPAPRGRPGGPGLYRVHGMGHTPYLQQVVKALIEKRGMRPDKAYAIARAAIRKWSVRSRHPEVKGAATAAEAGELARQARAHAHANQPPRVIDLVGPHGFIHGWHFVGIPGVGAKVMLPGRRVGTVIGGTGQHARIRTANGDIYKIPHDKGSGPARLVKDPGKPAPAPAYPKLSPERARMKAAADKAIARGETLFHGTNHQFKPGDTIDASYSRPGVTKLHEGKSYAFASTDPGEATFAGRVGREGHVYRVVPVDQYEYDPHQGSATSRRTSGSFRVVEEVQQWSGKRLVDQASDWTVADCLVELACDDPGAVIIDLFNPYHSPTGQFTTASGAGQGQGKQQQAAQRADRKGDKAQRAHLVRQIASLHQQIASLRAQLPQHGRSRSSTPAKRGAGAQSAKQAAQAKAGAQAAGKPGAPAKARKPGMSTATIHAKIAALRAELAADIAQLRSIK